MYVDCRDILSLQEFEELARQCMTQMAYEFVASGAADEHTLRWNREAFDRMRLRPRVLRDVATVDTRVTLLGRDLAYPILLAPTAYHRVLHPDGELETARGAGAAGITWIVSMSTTTAIADIARVATSPLWFQLYRLYTRGRAAGGGSWVRGALPHRRFADHRPPQSSGARAFSAAA